MSKRQEKIQANIVRQQEFLNERRITQLGMLQRAYDVGMKLYEDNKDKLSPEEIEQIEAMKLDQLAALEKVKSEINQDPQT
jgi:hypothetical protein